MATVSISMMNYGKPMITSQWPVTAGLIQLVKDEKAPMYATIQIPPGQSYGPGDVVKIVFIND